jgi:hypothetical protein
MNGMHVWCAVRSVYDSVKRLIAGSEDADDNTLVVQLFAGGLAGGSAAGRVRVYLYCVCMLHLSMLGSARAV